LKATPAPAAVFPNTLKEVTLESTASFVGSNLAGATTLETLNLNGSVAPVAAFNSLTGVKTLNIGSGFSTEATNADLATALGNLASLETISVAPGNATFSATSPTDVALVTNTGALIRYPAKNDQVAYTLPNNVTTIQAGAFSGATNITSLTVPGALSNVASTVFPTNLNTLILRNPPSSAPATIVVFPASVTSVTLTGDATVVKGNFAGDADNIRSLTLNGNGVPGAAFFGALNVLVTELKIGSNFYGTVIADEDGTIGSSIINANLDKITVDPENINFMSKSDALLSKDGAILYKYPVANTAITYNLNGVKEIKDNAFKGAALIETLSNVSSVTDIGESAFEGCVKLAAVALPATIRSIGDAAFKGDVLLATATFTALSPTTATLTIGDSAFEGCEKLSAPTLPSGLTSIGEAAFAGCVCEENSVAVPPIPGFVSINIPNTVTTIGASAFEGCSELVTVTFADGTGTSAARIQVIEADTFKDTKIEEIVLPKSLTTIKAGAFVATDSPGDDTLEKLTVTGNVLATIEAGALPAKCDTVILQGTPAAAARFPATVVNVVLDGGSGDKINFPAPIANITVTISSWTEGALDNFEGLTKLELSSTFSDDLTGDSFAAVPDITTLTIEGTNAKYDAVNNTLFGKSNSKNETLIKYYKATSSTDTYTVPADVVTIADGAFKGADLSGGTGLAFAASSALVTIGKEAFVGATLETVTFTNTTGLTLIDEGAFKGTAISGATFVTTAAAGLTIGKEAFMGCIALETPVLTGVKVIGEAAFMNCKVASGGTAVFDAITIPITVTDIGKNAFNGCADLATLTITNGALPAAQSKIETVGDGAFFGTAITEVDFGNAPLTAIGTIPTNGDPLPVGAFQGTALESVTLSAAVAGLTIGANTFKGCESLETVDLTGVKVIGESAFEGCNASGASGFTAIEIKNTITAIGKNAFKDCVSVAATALTFENTSTLETIGEGAFQGLTAITGVSIPGSVTSIGLNAFAGCAALTTLTLEGGNPGIAAGAFGTVPINSLVVSGALTAALSNLPTSIVTLTLSAAQTVSFAALTGVRTLVLDTVAQTANPVGLPDVTTLTLNFAQTQTFATMTGVTTLNVDVTQTSVFSALLIALRTLNITSSTAVVAIGTQFAAIPGLTTVNFSGAEAHTVANGAFPQTTLTTVIFGTGVTGVVIAANGSFREPTSGDSLMAVYGSSPGTAGTYTYAATGWTGP
jgi:hypothetical protein